MVQGHVPCRLRRLNAHVLVRCAKPRPLCPLRRLLRFLRVYRLVMSLLRNGVYATLVMEVGGRTGAPHVQRWHVGLAG